MEQPRRITVSMIFLIVNAVITPPFFFCLSAETRREFKKYLLFALGIFLLTTNLHAKKNPFEVLKEHNEQNYTGDVFIRPPTEIKAGAKNNAFEVLKEHNKQSELHYKHDKYFEHQETTKKLKLRNYPDLYVQSLREFKNSFSFYELGYSDSVDYQWTLMMLKRGIFNVSSSEVLQSRNLDIRGRNDLKTKSSGIEEKIEDMKVRYSHTGNNQRPDEKPQESAGWKENTSQGNSFREEIKRKKNR